MRSFVWSFAVVVFLVLSSVVVFSLKILGRLEESMAKIWLLATLPSH